MSRTATSPATARPDADGFATHRSVAVHLTGGLDGAHRVITMLRTRRYPVRDLSVSIREGVVVSEVRCTVVSTAADATLLLERLRRIPVVVAAEHS